MNLRFLKSKESKNAMWIIGGKVAQMILSLFVGVLSARYLGPANYGTISYATALVSFFTSFCTLGLHNIVVKDLLENPQDEGKTVGSAIFMRIVTSVLSCIMIVCVSFVLDYGDWETVAVVVLCSISLIFRAFDTINYWFQSQYKSKVNSIATLIGYVIVSMYKIWLLVLQKSVIWFAFASALDHIAITVVQLIAYKRHNGAKFSVSWAKGKALLGQSYHYILSGMMVAIYGQTDKLMLKQMLDETSVGYYATATAICSMWTFVLSAIIESMYPTIIMSFKKDKETFERKNRQLYAIVFYVTCFVSVCFLLLGDLAIRILYGEAYAPAAMPLKIVTWYTAFSYFGVARGAWMVCNQMQKYLKYMYIFAALANIVMNILLIPMWGPSGAALASLVTQILTSIVLPLCIRDLRPNAKLMLEAIMLKKLIQPSKEA